MGDSTTTDLLFLALQHLTMNGLGSQDDTSAIADKIESKRSFGAKMACAELWICAAFMGYSLALFAKGIMWKDVLILPLILSMFYTISLPLGTSISELLAESPVCDQLPRFVAGMLSARGCALTLGMVATLLVLAFYGYFRFTPMLLLAFCLKSILALTLNIDNFALSFLLLIATLALFISYRKQFYYAENLIIAVLFCLSGGMLFLSLCSISTGHPQRFMGGEPRASDFALWIGLSIAGFLLQINSDTAFK